MDFSYQLHVLSDTLDYADPSGILKGNSMGGSIARTSYRLKCEIDSYILTKYDISKQIH